MNSFVTKGLYCALFVGGLSLLGIGAANAAETSGDDGLASGTQLAPVLDAPVTVGGNAISIIGDSSSGSTPDASSAPDTATPPSANDAAPSATTSGTDSIASGSQAVVNTMVPATVSGNAISVIGDSSASGTSGESSEAPASGGRDDQGTTAETSGARSPLGGTQVPVQVGTPVIATGNAVSVLGDSSSGGASSAAPGSGRRYSAAASDGSDSALGGIQVVPVTSAPVTVAGNAFIPLGDSGSADAPARQGNSDSSGGSIAGSGSSVPVTSVPVASVALLPVGRTRMGFASGAALTGGGFGADRSTPASSAIPVVSIPWTPSAAAFGLPACAWAGVADGAAMLAAARMTALTKASMEAPPMAALAALFPLAGFALLLVARRRLGRPIRL